jgi:hypothetical protein
MAAAFAAIALTGVAAGCEGEKTRERSAADAGAQDTGPAQPVIGGKLGAAVAAAASGGAPSPSAQAVESSGAPPESGVFTPAGAAAALPRDRSHTIEVISDGGEPRVKLAAPIDVKGERRLSATLGLRMGGPQGLPNLDLGLRLKADKPKEGAAKAADAGASALTITARVTSATLASMSLGGPPRELSDLIGALKGSSIRYELSPENRASGFRFELAKGVDPGLQPLLEALGEGIGLLTPPLPDKPVGAGAYWMVTDRASASGARLPVLRYRVYKLEKLEGSTASITMDTRQYADGPDMKLPGGGREMTLTIDRLDSSGKGSIRWSAGAFAPLAADVSQRLQALLVPPGSRQAAQGSVVQVELTVKLSEPAAP